MFLISLLLAGALYLTYFYMTKTYTYWKNKGVPGPNPGFLYGTFKTVIDKRLHTLHEVSKLYKKYKGKTKAIGVFYGVKPFLLVTDPQLAKKIMITDFSHFTDTIAYKCDKETDPFIGRNPNFMRGEEWKKGRNEIIPAFTKLRVKALFPIMQEVAGRMKKYIHEENRMQDAFEMREITAKFTTDVVTLCIYGVESGTFSGEESEVRNVAKNVMYPAWRSFFTLGFVPFFPMLTNFLKMKLCPDKDANFLVKLLSDTLNYRKENNIKRQDFMDHIMFLRDKKGISDVEVAAHAFTFFFDGIETSSLTLSKLFYQLAKSKTLRKSSCEETSDYSGFLSKEHG